MQLKPLPTRLRALVYGQPATPIDVLHSAAKDGQTERMLQLLNNGIDADVRSTSNWTALQVASAHNKCEAVEVLLSHGAKVDLTKDNGLTALHLAAANGNREIVRTLLEHGANLKLESLNEKFTALHLAALRGQVSVLELLIEHTEDIEAGAHYGMTALHCASREGHDLCVSLLAQAGANIDTRAEPEYETPLMTAAAFDHTTTIWTLLSHGADIDAVQRSGRTAVQVAAYFGNLDATRTLIDKGAYLDVMDNDGYTALRCSLEWKHPEVAMALLQNRVRISTLYGPHSDTALHLAVRHEYLEVAEQLISKGADLHACDIDGDPPLQWAVQKGYEKMVKCLLRHGAEVNKRNQKSGETVLKWAVECGHVAVTELLLGCGADASLLDLSTMEKLEEAGEEEFETCKALVETSEFAQPPNELLLKDESSQPQNRENVVEGKLGRESSETKRASIVAKRIRYQILDIPAQSGAEEVGTQSPRKVEHPDVSCDGPLCKRSAASILGARFKCTVCENVDFCEECVASFYNQHDTRHAMVKCLLPTTFRVIRDIDKIAKEKLLQNCGRSWSELDDLTHVIYAETQQEYHLQSRSSSVDVPEKSLAHQSINEPEPTMFVILRSKSPDPVSQRREIVRYGEIDSKNGVSMYKIDEAGNVSVNSRSIGSDSVSVREEGQIHDYQDPALLARVLTGQLQQYTYPERKDLYRLASEGHIPTRVIGLLPGDFEDKLEIEIRLIDMAEEPKYEALSWTWKETTYERVHCSSWTKEEDEVLRKMAKISHAVYCREPDGRESFLVISAGLRDALRRLRDKSDKRTLWIDQLSINQSDLREREFQVSKMRVFYNRSRQVRVWTGDEDDCTESVYDILRKIAQASRVLGYLPRPDELIEDANLDLPASEASIWSAVMSYFLRPVFGRCWVIQEIVVGQKVSLHCGDYSIAWEDVALAVKVLSTGPWLRVLPRTDDDRKAFFLKSRPEAPRDDALQRLPFNNLPNVCTIIGIREDFQSLREISLETLLYLTGMFGATDPRDRIYSLLGIRSAKIDPNRSESLHPEYNKSVADVFMQATKACILESGSLNICGMHTSISDKVIEGLPSWVPDYSSSLHSCATSFCRPESRSAYCASGDSDCLAVWSNEQRPNLLATSSCRVETIAEVARQSLSEDSPLGALIEEWTKMASKERDYVTGEFTADAFWRTCVGDGTLRLRKSPAPDSYHAPLAIFFGCQFLQHAGLGESRDGSEVTDADVMSALGEHTNTLIATLMADAFAAAPDWMEVPPSTLELDPDAVPAFWSACSSRTFFVTANGYFGIGPRDARVGDEIHILSGTRVPFVLRKADDVSCGKDSELSEDGDDTPLYSMIGETYVHGIMQGQCLKREAFEWGGVCLV